MSKWQHNGWKEWFEITGADGVDFHNIGYCPEKGDPILPGGSYTKEEFFKAKTYPRSGYTFWKLINGEKYYISLTQPPKKLLHKVSITASLEYVEGHLRRGYRKGAWYQASQRKNDYILSITFFGASSIFETYQRNEKCR